MQQSVCFPLAESRLGTALGREHSACSEASVRSALPDLQRGRLFQRGRRIRAAPRARGPLQYKKVLEYLSRYGLPGSRPNISESHSQMSTRVPFCIAPRPAQAEDLQDVRARRPWLQAECLCFGAAGLAARLQHPPSLLHTRRTAAMRMALASAAPPA